MPEMPYLIFERAAGVLRLQNGRCNGCGEGSSAALRQQTGALRDAQISAALTKPPDLRSLHYQCCSHKLYEQPRTCRLRHCNSWRDTQSVASEGVRLDRVH